MGVVRPGDVVSIGAAASVQFAGDRALVMRVIRMLDRPTYQGWQWMEGYVLNRRGQAVRRREVYVRLAGLCPAPDGQPGAA